MKRLLLLTFTFFYLLSSYGQEKYFIYFTDKNNSPFSISNPTEFLSQKSIDRRSNQGISIKTRDLPVNPNYVDSINTFNVEVWYTSKWLNAALIVADSVTVDSLMSLSFVNNNEVLQRPTQLTPSEKFVEESSFTYPKQVNNKVTELDYGYSFDQNNMLQTNTMHAHGYTGAGLTIAVLDNGFTGVDLVNQFQQLRDQNKILGVYDFVQNNSQVYDDGSHGTYVLSTMAAFDEQEIIGTAYDASFYLFVTENNAAELLDEEVYWLIAAEKADSLGVDLINTSLGYSKFDNPALDHVYNDLDGRTNIISIASEIAANTGMLIVTSAGNEGSGSWTYITSPGDADSIITVGAVDADGVKAYFSSIGPTPDGRIKPDLAAMGVSTAIVTPGGSVALGGGTSFSSPLLCGLAAGFWQAHPDLTSFEVIDYLKQSATQFNSPDNELGWGIPNFTVAHELAGGTIDSNLISAVNSNFSEDFDIIVHPNPAIASEPIRITLNEEIFVNTLSVQNILGEDLIVEKINKKTKSIKFEYNFKPGQYLIKLNLDNQTKIKKVIVR